MRILYKILVYVGGSAALITFVIVLFLVSEINSINYDLDTGDNVDVSILDPKREIKTLSESDIAQNSSNTTAVEEEKYRLITIVSTTAFCGLMVFLIILLLMSKKLISTLSEILEFSNSLAKGDYNVKLKAHQKDEIGDIIKSMNYMRTRLENSISKIKRSHQREREARKDAEANNNLKSEFLANISKDLKNPLNSIIGFTDYVLKEIESGKYDEELNHKLKAIYSSAGKLNELISRLLELSKLNREDIELHITEFKTIDFMNEFINSCQFFADKKNIRFENHYSSTMPDKIRTDRDILFQILTTLVSNMLETNPENSVVSIGCECRGADLIFWLKDSRDEENQTLPLAKIYNRFIQEDSTLISDFGGNLLLNLTIARTNAQFLDSELIAEITPEGSSIFKVIIDINSFRAKQATSSSPFHTATNLRSLLEAEKNETRDLEDTGEIRAERDINVLMADDNSNNQFLTETIFRETEFRLKCVEDGISCLEKLHEESFDALILDLHIPSLNGYDVIQKVRDNAKFNDLSIIVVTTYLREDERETLIGLGANDCLMKPIDANELLNALRRTTP